ncbi:hypothetical protein B0H17DRAFT_1149924 [Mycena rosella]|uniref:Uncharacterized protein n=1 Tax=Mycena rosella TaxID=1033263 RepID=A0AAD7BY81_MYCRO|nr:hypothetical protein B0H17DRAFT_1149924 [Mycena rosella]
MAVSPTPVALGRGRLERYQVYQARAPDASGENDHRTTDAEPSPAHHRFIIGASPAHRSHQIDRMLLPLCVTSTILIVRGYCPLTQSKLSRQLRRKPFLLPLVKAVRRARRAGSTGSVRRVADPFRRGFAKNFNGTATGRISQSMAVAGRPTVTDSMESQSTTLV